MFRFDPGTEMPFACCDVCDGRLTDADQRLIYRSDRPHRCGVIHAACAERAYARLLLTDEEMQRIAEGHASPEIPYVVLKMSYARTFEVEHTGRFTPTF
jgi:hypothetical protein